MNAQEQLWAGDFGAAYTKRNRVDWIARARFWREIVAMTGIDSALEVGCNAGWNLSALRLVNPHITLRGLDVNEQSLREASACGFAVKHSTIVETAAAVRSVGFSVFPGCSMGLVFTAGVLIHVPPEELRATMDSIVALSNQYVLAVEYYAPKEEQVEYRGGMDRLWRRPYGRMYEEMGLTMVDQGFVDQSLGFDSCTWWLLEKR